MTLEDVCVLCNNRRALEGQPPFAVSSNKTARMDVHAHIQIFVLSRCFAIDTFCEAQVGLFFFFF